MNTLHVRKVTPRVILNRTRRPKNKEPHVLTFGRFLAALRHISHRHGGPQVITAIPRIFWINQLNLWNRNYRGSDLHKYTYEAGEYATRFPMGH